MAQGSIHVQKPDDMHTDESIDYYDNDHYAAELEIIE